MIEKLNGFWPLLFWNYISISETFHIKIQIDDGISDDFNIDTKPFVQLASGYYYFELNKKTNWYEAYEACRRRKGALVSIETWVELCSLESYIGENIKADRFWTSGTDNGHQGRYVWLTTGREIYPDIWWPDEPNSLNDTEHCVELSFDGPSWKKLGLRDVVCSLARPYICQLAGPITASVAIW